jgi:hypothetical protein
MAEKIIRNKKTYYLCKECGFLYKDRKIAQKCENWCKKHHSCNMEITKYAVRL